MNLDNFPSYSIQGNKVKWFRPETYALANTGANAQPAHYKHASLGSWATTEASATRDLNTNPDQPFSALLCPIPLNYNTKSPWKLYFPFEIFALILFETNQLLNACGHRSNKHVSCRSKPADQKAIRVSFWFLYICTVHFQIESSYSKL